MVNEKETEKGFVERKPKKLSEEEVAGILKERRRSIARRKEKRNEKRIEKIREKKLLTKEKLIPAEEAEEISEAEFLKGVAKGLKIETEGAFSGSGGFGTTDMRKKKEDMSPALEDSAGVCYNEEKDVKIELSDDGKFIGASVNGTELNL